MQAFETPGDRPSEVWNETLQDSPADKVSVGSVILLGLSGQQVVPSAIVGAAYLPLLSGRGAWLSMLVAMVATLCVMVAVNVFARRYVVTGSMMSYTGIVFGRRVERLVAASYLLGFLVACAAIAASTVMFASSFLQSLGLAFADSSAFQSIAAIMVAVLAGAICWRGLDTSIALTAWLALLSVPPVLTITIGAAINTGTAFQAQLSLQGVDWTTVLQGTVVGLAYFVGTDALASLAAETREPKKNVPIILNTVLVITGVVFVFTLLAWTPIILDHAAEITAGVSSTAVISQAAGMPYLQKPTDLLLVGATFSSLVAFINCGSRVFATAAQNSFLPAVFARSHPVYGSPTWATVLMAVASAAIPVALQYLSKSTPLESTAYLSTFFSLFWTLPYLILCAGAIFELRKEGGRSVLQITAIIIGLIAFGVLFCENFFLDSDNPMAALPYLMIVMIIGGYVLLNANERRSPVKSAKLP